MKKTLLTILASLGIILGSAFLTHAAVNCGQNFPTSLNLYASNCIVPSTWAQALEAKLGITGSSATSSLDYQINHLFTSYGSESITSSSLPWINYLTASSPSSTWLKTANNLSDLPSTSSARTNLGLGDSATLPSSTWMKPGNNLSELTSTSTARTNIGYSAGTNITISGAGAIGLTGQVAVANGGLGTSTASTDAQYLGSNGATPTWKSFVAGNNITFTTSTTSTVIAVNTSAAAAGSDSQIQFNNGGTFGATSTFTFTSSTQTLSVPNITGLNVTSSALGTNASGTIIAIGVPTNTTFSTSTTFGSASNTNVATMTLPSATTSTRYDIFFDISNNTGGFSETSTIKLGGMQIAQCSTNGGVGSVVSGEIRITMMNSTSSELINMWRGNGASGVGTVPCNTLVNTLTKQSIDMSSSPLITVQIQPSGSTSHTDTTIAQIIVGHN